jgi:alpha-glucosidase
MGEYDNFIHLYDYGQPDIHDVYRRLRRMVDSYPQQPVTIGEVHIFDLPEWASYYGEARDEMHMPFNFHLMATPWNAVRLRAIIESVLWNVPVGSWTNWTLGNHDEIRLTTRLGPENARLAAMLLLTLRGTPFLYYGDELGMTDAAIRPERARDPWGDSVPHLSRDGARTPMQWNSAPGAGFTTPGVAPWLPVGENYDRVNVESELDDEGSMLNLYRRLLRLRRGSVALRRGSYLSHPSSTEAVLVYRREADNETVTVALNLSDAESTVAVRSGRVAISTVDPDRADSVRGELELAPREGVIVVHG